MMINKRPNILFIQVDQQRYDSLGFTGHPLVKTPNLDRLRREGMSFTNAFTPIPLCCPARQTLLSGVMPEVHGGLWNYDTQKITGLTNDFVTWSQLLKDEGFRTSYFGKWHVSGELDPTSFGYDRYTAEVGEWPPENLEKQYAMPDNPVWPYMGFKSSLPVEKSPTHLLADQVIKEIERYHNESKPWHVRIDFSEPHLPCTPCEPYASMYNPEEIEPWDNFTEDFKNKPYIQLQQLKNWEIENWDWEEWSRYLAAYFGIITQYDAAIGKILDSLENLEITDNTIVIYTTDHGDAAGSHRMLDKHYVMYDEEVHVPLLIRLPGVIEADSICSDFVMNALDLGPTILDFYDIPIPKSFQGKSFLPQLKGQINSRCWPLAFSTYHGQQFGLYDMRMIRDKRYKYVFNPTDIDEFYDLQEDPAELNNLIGSKIDRQLGNQYRQIVFDTFFSLDDRLMTKSKWMENQLRR